MVDESYVVVGAHLDENMVSKISEGKYVDFSKLIPHDRIVAEEDVRMEMVMRNGRTFWSPVSSGVIINNFGKWEQAFRVFSNIYCKVNPHRSTELIEYNHVIHTISMAYTWENVYQHDKEFRLHMARNPGRSWGIILQQAWSLRLCDRIHLSGASPGSSGNNHSSHGFNTGDSRGHRSKVNEPCRRFNRGRCNYGNANCKFEHQCSYCFKFGHGSVTCRKAQADRRRSGENHGEKREYDEREK